MKQIELVIFDMDGLLFDTEPIFFRAIQRSAKKLGVDFTFETYLKTVGVTDETGKKMLSEIYGKDSSILQAMDQYGLEFDKILEEEGLTVKAGAEQLLNTLDEKGIKKCIASSSSVDMIQRNVQLTGLDNRFDFYLSGTEVKNGKPSPDIFLEALKRAGVAAENALVLEDSYHGLKAAVAANIPCIVVPDLIEPTDEMRSLAKRVCNDLLEVADLI